MYSLGTLNHTETSIQDRTTGVVICLFDPNAKVQRPVQQ